MGKMVKNLFGGGGKQRVNQANNEARARQEAAVAQSRQQQSVAVADTERSVSRARRTPRGRRQLIGNEQSTIG